MKNKVLEPLHESSTVKLTLRQKDCLYFLVMGLQVKEIAHKLGLSKRTVEHYIQAVKIKLNCYSRSELIKKAMQIPTIRQKIFLSIFDPCL